MRANIYIDGFNLYYGCLKGTPYRWLDVHALAQNLFPNDQINKIKYFTARVTARDNDPDQPVRQDTYLRALQTLPGLSITFGRFQTKPTEMWLVKPQGNNKTALVYKTEEKGSDVNLASHLLHDGHRGDYQVAIVISNDSDLAEATRLVKEDIGLPVGILCPYTRVTNDLRKASTFVKTITKTHLAASQFPIQLTDATGEFHKPTSW